MSWSASGNVEVGNNGTAGPFMPRESPAFQVGHGERESKIAFEKAKDAAIELLNTLSLGRGKFDVRLSGHANPGNEKSPQWSNDFVTITITQL